MIKAQPSQQKFSFTAEVEQSFPRILIKQKSQLSARSILLTTLTSLLCIRAQLPTQLGGLSSNVVFIDCANTFDADKIAPLRHKLNRVTHQWHVKESTDFRAFTAYQFASLIMEKLIKNIICQR